MSFDLMSLANSGRQATDNEPMPGRGRRRTHNPFDDIITKLSATGQSWIYEGIPTTPENGSSVSPAAGLENALRAAGNRLDQRSKDTQGPGYKTTVRKEPDGEGTVKVWVTVESRAASQETESTDETATPARGRRNR